jgi:hypothetical protein
MTRPRAASTGAILKAGCVPSCSYSGAERAQIHGWPRAPVNPRLVCFRARLDLSHAAIGVFTITEQRMVTLRDWLDRVEPIEPEDRDGVLLKLFFGAFGDPEAGRRQLLDYRERVEQRLATYREIERTFDGERGTPALRRLQSLRLGIALMQASLAWADETLQALAPAATAGERP